MTPDPFRLLHAPSLSENVHSIRANLHGHLVSRLQGGVFRDTDMDGFFPETGVNVDFRTDIAEKFHRDLKRCPSLRMDFHVLRPDPDFHLFLSAQSGRLKVQKKAGSAEDAAIALRRNTSSEDVHLWRPDEGGNEPI